ncbi:Hypothetical predicted protein [Xyrichtys novacula]|uniref:Uncharacterized protein n=1 Tax=Xyrichtys novacula TaxID=13765 RepID=A0AAV1H9Q7_XYRNO|nr:Hypothetical predicted protein [Xyrichtys novacula]
MRLCDERDDGHAAASCSSRNFHQLSASYRSCRQQQSADEDKQPSRAEFPAAVYFLMKQNQSQELIEPSAANFSLKIPVPTL